MNVPDHYRSLHRQGELLLNEMLSDQEATTAHTKSHNYILDFERIHGAVAHRPESTLYHVAIKEYQFALLALSVGRYRHSFMSLRLFFELALAAIHFSAHEIDYHLWKRGSKDVNWRSIKCPHRGLSIPLTCPALTGGAFSDRHPAPAHEHFLRWRNSSPPTPWKNFYYLGYMLHIIVIVAFIGVAVVCHMIGTNNTIYRE